MVGVLTLSEGVQGHARLAGLDAEEPLPLEVEQMLLLELLDLQELLLEGKLLGRHLPKTHTHTHARAHANTRKHTQTHTRQHTISKHTTYNSVIPCVLRQL